MHTKGEWKSNSDGEISVKGAVIAHVFMSDEYPCFDGDESKLEKECQANAHLIAAAPDMYEVLKLISRLDKTVITTGEFITRLVPLVQVADEALAKAEGK